MTTKVTALQEIEEIKGTCPKCGGSLEFRTFIESWDNKGKPEQVSKDPYCPICDLKWLAEEGPHDFFEG